MGIDGVRGGGACQTRLHVLWRYGTVCPRSNDKSYIVTYYIKWVTTFWTYSIILAEITIKVEEEVQVYFL